MSLRDALNARTTETLTRQITQPDAGQAPAPARTPAKRQQRKNHTVGLTPDAAAAYRRLRVISLLEEIEIQDVVGWLIERIDQDAALRAECVASLKGA